MNELNHIKDALIGQGGVVAMFIIALVSGYKQKWVWGREKTEALSALAAMTVDRDRWQERCLRDIDEVRQELRKRLAAGPSGVAQ